MLSHLVHDHDFVWLHRPALLMFELGSLLFTHKVAITTFMISVNFVVMVEN
jgi:hypothetical protein